MKILLTGGGGFIGRNILEQLGSVGCFFAPSSRELDLLDRVAVERFLKENRITHVIHSAVFNDKRRLTAAGSEITANLKMFYNLVEHAATLEKIIYFGSGAEYDKRYPVASAKETDFGSRIPLLNDYGMSKYLMNLEARNSSNIYNLRLFGVFGKHEDWKSSFVSNLCCKAVFDLPLTIRQECVFDFIHVDRLMPVVQWFLDNEPRYHDYNVCSAKPCLLRKIAQLVKTVSGKNIDVVILNEGMNLEYTGSRDRLELECPMDEIQMSSDIEALYRYYEKIKDRISYNELKNCR